MPKNKVSVVMAVYKNDKAPWVRESIDSILNQTLKADEIIIVVDGPIPTDIEGVLSSYSDSIKVIRVKDNTGLWNALNVGIAAARNELIARMDSDDIALAGRLNSQVDMFTSNVELDILGGQVDEFEIPGIVTGRRTVPEEADKIKVFARRRSPFNHPTVMYRKSFIEKVGGYRNLRRSEDYDLWMRSIQAGAHIANMPDTLVLMRVDSDGVNRRRRWSTVKEQLSTRYGLYRSGMVRLSDLVIVACGQIVIFVVPVRIAKLIYDRALRR